MKLILLRHGTRDIGSVANNGLNATGKTMAENLVAEISSDSERKITQILASPKKRAQETLAPLAKALAIPVQVEKKLDERALDETGEAFYSRIKNYLLDLPKKFGSVEVVCVCSHADWLEEAVLILGALQKKKEAGEPFISLSFACAESRVYIYDGQHWSQK